MKAPTAITVREVALDRGRRLRFTALDDSGRGGGGLHVLLHLDRGELCAFLLRLRAEDLRPLAQTLDMLAAELGAQP